MSEMGVTLPSVVRGPAHPRTGERNGKAGLSADTPGWRLGRRRPRTRLADRRRLEHGAERIALAQRFEVGVLPGKSPVLGVERDGTAEVLERGGRVLTPRHRHRHHVMRVIVLRILGERALQVVDGRGLVAGVERHRRRIHPLLGGSGIGLLRHQLALADLEIEARALEELALVGITLDDAAQGVGGGGKVMTLKGLKAALVEGDGFVIGRLPQWRRRWLRSSGSRVNGGGAGGFGARRTPGGRNGPPPGGLTSGGAGAGGPARLRHRSRRAVGSVSRKDSSKSLAGGSRWRAGRSR